MESAKVGKRGTIVVPAKLRKRFGLDEGSFVTAEAREEAVDGSAIAAAQQRLRYPGSDRAEPRGEPARQHGALAHGRRGHPFGPRAFRRREVPIFL